MGNKLGETAEMTAIPELDEKEARQIEERIEVSAPVVHEAIRLAGEKELHRPTQALAFSGLAAGLSMGFSFVAEALLRSHLPDQPWRPLVSKLGYPLGFLLVVIGRQQLFTENTLTVIIPLLARRNMKTLLQVLRLWTTVLISNLVGAHAFAWAVGNTPVFKPEIRQAFGEIARESAAVAFGPAVLKGIFAGWLIAMMVWLLAAADERRVALIVIPTYIVGLASLTHIIAGSVEVLFLVMTGAMAWTAYLGGYMLPTLIGNCIGGVALVSALNHAQVVAGKNQSGQNQ